MGRIEMEEGREGAANEGSFSDFYLSLLSFGKVAVGYELEKTLLSLGVVHNLHVSRLE